MIISKSQAKAARAGLGLRREDLAKAAGVSERTITDFERGAREPILATRQAIRRALEEAGAIFEADGHVTVPSTPYSPRTDGSSPGIC